LQSKKDLAVILFVVIVVLAIVDYQKTHVNIMTSGVKFDFQYVPPIAPEIKLPVVPSVVQSGQTEASAPSNPSSIIRLTSTPSGNSQSSAVPLLGVYNGDPSSRASQPLNAIDWCANGGGSIIPG
jgi:hypothetical protein